MSRAKEHKNILELQGVSRFFGGMRAVDDVSFQVAKGCIKTMIGPNGAGKTTLFNLIAGNLPLSRGSIRFLGREIKRKKPHQITRLGMARTFQNIKLFQGMTALECVMLGCHSRSRAGFLAGMLSVPWTWGEERCIRTRAMQLLEMLEIAELADVEANSLAFGQQRAVEMARALAAEPKLLLLDEPAAGLNIYETAEIGRLVRKLKEMGITILLVEHDMSLVMDISDEILVLCYGRKLAEDVPEAIQHNKEVIRVYLGEENATAN